MATGFIRNNILFDEVLKYCDGMKFWGYVGTNAASLCVELYTMSYICKIFNLLLNNAKKKEGGLVLSRSHLFMTD
jgi:hypothetical protein